MATVRVPVSALACAVRSVARDWTRSMRVKAMVWAVLARDRMMLTLNPNCTKREGGGRGKTDIDDVLDLTKDSGDGLADDGDGVEETGLADEDVEEGLVNADELLRFQLVNDCGVLGIECGEYLTSRKASKMASLSAPAGTGSMFCIWEMATVAVETMSVNPVMICYSVLSALPVSNIHLSRATYREGTLADDDQRTVNGIDALGRRLQSLALLSDHLDVSDDLSGRQLCEDRSADGQGRGDDGAEGNHGDDCSVEWFGWREREVVGSVVGVLECWMMRMMSY
jgi:hypothetical protein